MESISANGNTTAQEWDSTDPGLFVTQGTFDGATIKLQASFDNGSTFNDVGGLVTFTSAGKGKFHLPPCQLRVNTASGGASLAAEYGIFKY